MRFSAIVAGLFASTALAGPMVARSQPCDEDGAPCMTMEQAQKVASNFKELIATYSDAAANKYLTVDFVDYSDSVAELINEGCPNGPATLGEATFSSRAEFKAGQGAQPPIPFEQLNIWHTCDTVIIRWRTTVEEGAPEFVTGLIVMETRYVGGAEPFKIDTVYSEFNSGAWLVDLGVFEPTCDASEKRDLDYGMSPVRMI